MQIVEDVRDFLKRPVSNLKCKEKTERYPPSRIEMCNYERNQSEASKALWS